MLNYQRVIDNYDGIILSNQPCYGMNMMNQPTIWTMYWAIIFCDFSRIWSRWLLLFSHWLTRESIPPKRQIQDVSLRDFSGLKCVNMGNMQATCSFSPTESGMANTEECQRWVGLLAYASYAQELDQKWRKPMGFLPIFPSEPARKTLWAGSAFLSRIHRIFSCE
mgnify:CR=1 FL=1